MSTAITPSRVLPSVVVDGLRQGQVKLVFDRRAVDVGEDAFACGGRQLVPGAFAGIVDGGFGFDQLAAVAGAADEVVGAPSIAGADLPHDEALFFPFHSEKSAVGRPM